MNVLEKETILLQEVWKDKETAEAIKRCTLFAIGLAGIDIKVHQAFVINEVLDNLAREKKEEPQKHEDGV